MNFNMQAVLMIQSLEIRYNIHALDLKNPKTFKSEELTWVKRQEKDLTKKVIDSV